MWTNWGKSQCFIDRKWTKKILWYSVRNVALLYVLVGFSLKFTVSRKFVPRLLCCSKINKKALKTFERRIEYPVKHLRWSFLQKWLTFESLNYFCKKLYLRCLTGFTICLCFWCECNNLYEINFHPLVKILSYDPLIFIKNTSLFKK